MSMDSIEASVEVIRLIRATLLFVHGVIKDRSPEGVATALIGYHNFLDAFADLCFSDATGVLRYACVPELVVFDVQCNLHSLNKALSAHREAWRYVSVPSETRRKGSAVKLGANGDNAIVSKANWRHEIRQRSQLWSERASPGVHSTLFAEEEMEALISACTASIDHLRHSLAVAMLLTSKSAACFVTGMQTAHLGIADVLERQRQLDLRPSNDCPPLPGRLKKSISAMDIPKSFLKRVYSDGREETDVIVEICSYSDMPSSCVPQLMRRLQTMVEPCHEKKERIGYGMRTLTCLGYIDDSRYARTLILYRSPKSHPWASDPPSLHETMSEGWTAKFSLTQRFFCARTLAASVLDFHTSGSMHGDLSSHSFAMLPCHLDDMEPSPYLLGWRERFNRPGDSTLLKSEVYRHRARFGGPSSTPMPEHDIYSLGVILLEIGLWTAMSTVFSKLLESTPRFSTQDAQKMFESVNQVIKGLAHSPDLGREMGAKYALVVQKCLDWKCQERASSLLRFRSEVVDVLDAGCKL